MARISHLSSSPSNYVLYQYLKRDRGVDALAFELPPSLLVNIHARAVSIRTSCIRGIYPNFLKSQTSPPFEYG
ncbi:hypothetical protein SCP_0501700 [Sparassis crispa]|uniref:Uncharacterized protein n=1 Tax=Sparassis crispa TaxID=139825 RepID=A0A401GLP7_9APHY|nr:hypothetical protein SCP_0501700 [Sparassis crispa]GBE83123.1 hypothetical protein SCP_0501700 [Sparassis crispa]